MLYTFIFSAAVLDRLRSAFSMNLCAAGCVGATRVACTQLSCAGSLQHAAFDPFYSSSLLLLLLLIPQVVGSLMYFQRALVVSTSVRGPSQRTAFFAALNTWSAACILLMQLFATSSVLRHLGMQVRRQQYSLLMWHRVWQRSAACIPAALAVLEMLPGHAGAAVGRYQEASIANSAAV
jgi:ATP/ADP translocase